MKKILLFGDSNTWGHNPVDFTQLPVTWGKIVSELLPQYDITIDGECGRATLVGEGAKNGIAVFRERVLLKKPHLDLAVIMLGTNDMLCDIAYEPKRTALALGQYISEARAVYGEDAPEFLIISPILINKACLSHPVFSELYDIKSVENSRLLAGEIENMTKVMGAHFMNAADYAEPSDIDGIHMTEDEHRKLGYAAAEKIKEILKDD